jgi:glucans biosynthesis protein C
MQQETGQATERYHAWDALRAVLMFLGVYLHGILSFTQTPVPFWPVHDSETSIVHDFLLFAIHDFRMQSFFFLSGFFSALVVQRKGVRAFVQQRLLRVALPFAVGMIVLMPILKYLWLIGKPSAWFAVGLSGELAERYHAGENGLFWSHIAFSPVFPHYLWFLHFLCWYTLTAVVLRGFHRLLPGASRVLNTGFRLVMGHRLRVLILAALLMPFLQPMHLLIIDTPGGWFDFPHVFAYYFVFFGMGWLSFYQQELLFHVARQWRLHLCVATLILPAYGLLSKAGINRILTGQANDPQFEWIRQPALYLGALYSWCMLFGLIGCFQRYFGGENPRWRYLADASYWCYLASVPPLIALQFVVAGWKIPLLLKLGFVLGVCTVGLLASYHFLVRFTIIGRCLNGKRIPAR